MAYIENESKRITRLSCLSSAAEIIAAKIKVDGTVVSGATPQGVIAFAKELYTWAWGTDKEATSKDF